MLFFYSSCYSQVDKELISNWKIHPVPTNPDTLQKYNYSFQNECAVFLKNDSVHVYKRREPQDDDLSLLPFKFAPGKKEAAKMHGIISLLSVDDGYLVGFDRGEWGGYLYWFSKEGKKHYQVSTDQIVQFIKKSSEVYAIQGLAHMGISEGSIIKIKKLKNKWISKEYLKLPTAPFAIALHNTSFIVITSKSLFEITNDNKISTLVETGIWNTGLYPNSIVVSGNKAYAGMRAGVFEYDLLSRKQNWLLPY